MSSRRPISLVMTHACWGIPAAISLALAGARYRGSALVFTFFAVCYLLLVALMFPKPRVYVYTFLTGFLFLGFWLKVVVHAIWSPGFVEPIGDFSGTPHEWDLALLAASWGALGAATPRFVHLILRSRRASHEAPDLHLTVPSWFRHTRRVVWTVTFASVLVLNAANYYLAFYQVGVNPKLVLPYHLNAPLAWLINIGFALWFATLVHWEFALSKLSPLTSLLIPMVEGLLSSVSTMSRFFFLLHAGPYWIVLMEHWSNWKNRLSRRMIIALAACSAAFLALSLLTVSWLRVLDFHEAELNERLHEAAAKSVPTPAAGAKDVPPATAPHSNPSRLRVLLTYQRDVLFLQLPTLFVHRWVGLEGVLVVGSLGDRGWDLFVAAVTDDPRRGGESLFQQRARTQFLAADAKTYTFLSNSGIIALLFYSDSFLIVMAGMAMITAILMATERLMELASRNTFLLAVAGAASANVVCQMTFPYLAGIFLLQMWVAIAFLAFIQHTDVALSKFREPSSR
jgi:hypothetical protein